MLFAVAWWELGSFKHSACPEEAFRNSKPIAHTSCELLPRGSATKWTGNQVSVRFPTHQTPMSLIVLRHQWVQILSLNTSSAPTGTTAGANAAPALLHNIALPRHAVPSNGSGHCRASFFAFLLKLRSRGSGVTDVWLGTRSFWFSPVTAIWLLQHWFWFGANQRFGEPKTLCGTNDCEGSRMAHRPFCSNTTQHTKRQNCCLSQTIVMTYDTASSGAKTSDFRLSLSVRSF